jgi:folate-dependent tRNA-U54 methylase TrmFO/GidA
MNDPDDTNGYICTTNEGATITMFETREEAERAKSFGPVVAVTATFYVRYIPEGGSEFSPMDQSWGELAAALDR